MYVCSVLNTRFVKWQLMCEHELPLRYSVQYLLTMNPLLLNFWFTWLNPSTLNTEP